MMLDSEVVFKHDIESLCRLFLLSPANRKSSMVANIDMFLLLLNRNEDKKLFYLLCDELFAGDENKKKLVKETFPADASEERT